VGLYTHRLAMPTLTPYAVQVIQEAVAKAVPIAVSQALDRALGTSSVDTDGNLITPLSTSELQTLMEATIRAIIGQNTIPKSSNWSMSNNRSNARLNGIDNRLNMLDQARIERGLVIEQMQAAHEALKASIPDLISTAINAYNTNIVRPLIQTLTGVQDPNVAHSLLELYNLLQAENAEDAATLADVLARINTVKLAAAAAQLTADQAQATGSDAQTKLAALTTNVIPALQAADTANANVTATQKGRIDYIVGTNLPALQTADITNTTAINTERTRVDTLVNTTVPALQTADSTNTSAIATQKTRVDTLLTTTVPALQVADTTNSTAISTQTSRVDGLVNTTIPALQATDTTNASAITTQKNRVDTLVNTTVPALQAADTSNSTAITTQTSRIDGLVNTTVPALQAADTANTSAITTQKNRVDTLVNTTVPALQAADTTNSTAIATQTARIDGLINTTVPALQSADTTNSTAITALQASDTKIQSDLLLRLLTDRVRTKSVVTATMLAGSTVTGTITWDTPFADNKYKAVAVPVGDQLLGMTIALSNLTAAGCTITAKNGGLAALAANAGTIHIIAIHD
jgi:hypothetical protein